MIKKIILGVVTVICTFAVTGSYILYSNSRDAIKLYQNKVTIELGQNPDFQIKDYVKAKDNIYSKINMDVSDIDKDTVGSYQVFFTYNRQKLSVQVNVADTTSPSLIIESGEIVKRVGDSISISEIFYKCDDLSDTTVTFINGNDKMLLEKAEKSKITLIAKDTYGNVTKADVDLTIRDANAPVINNTKDLTTTVGTGLDLKEGITVTDVEDGDITEKLTCESNVDYNTVGSYKVKYSVVDNSGNQVVNEFTLNVTEKIITSSSSNVSSSSGNTGGSGNVSSSGYVSGYNKSTILCGDFSKLTTEEEKLKYIDKFGFDKEASDWYIFNYNVSQSEKIAKIRSSNAWANISTQAAYWWWDNIGSTLTVNQITTKDSSFYKSYMDTTGQSVEPIVCYTNSYNYGAFWISKSDAIKCANLGYLKLGTIINIFSINGKEYPPETVAAYYIENYDKLIKTCNIWIH